MGRATHYCTCRRCVRERRKGNILGTKPMPARWFGRLFIARYDAYVPFAKFARKGSRRPEQRFDASEVC